MQKGIVMLITYKARIYPNSEQRALIERTFGCARFVWNHMLDRSNKTYQRRHKGLGRFDMNYALTDLKHVYPWLYDADATALTSVIDNLNNAMKAVFKGNADLPKFKSKKSPIKSYTSKSSAIYYENGLVQLPKLGKLRVHNHRLPKDNCKIKRAIISRNKINEYYISLLVEEVAVALPQTDNTIGLDMGIEHFYTDSNGNKIPNPQFYSNSQAKVVREQQKLSKKKKGSKNYYKQKLRLAKSQLKVQRQREHFHNCLAKQLTDENQVICVETLKVKEMLEKETDLYSKAEHEFHKHIADSGWSHFLTKLNQKAQMTGRTVVKVDSYFPSSQICHCCGSKNPTIKNLSIREWTCPQCGEVHDRDINAARNILNEGLRILSQ